MNIYGLNLYLILKEQLPKERLDTANKKIEEIKAKLKTAKKDKMPVKER